ncbi:hypothetical protein J3F83DRAFT_573562 [Trichoderma novae-zelandiae]
MIWWKLLRLIATMYTKDVVVIDALDECVASNRSISRLLSYISGLRSDTAVSLFWLLRGTFQISRSSLKKAPGERFLGSEEDMHQYLEAHMDRLPSCLYNIDDLVHLNLDSLKGETSIADVKPTLKRLKNRKHEERGQDCLQNALEQAYNEAMDRIDRQSLDQQRLGRNALKWITVQNGHLLNWNSNMLLQSSLEIPPWLSSRRRDQRLTGIISTIWVLRSGIGDAMRVSYQISLVKFETL